MEIQPSTTKKTEAGQQPASSLPSNSASATGLILLLGAFLATFIAGLNELFLSGSEDKDLQKFIHLVGPAGSQIVTAFILWAYKRNAKRKFRAYAEYKINDVDSKISRLPPKPVKEYQTKLAKLEDTRKYWEDLLDRNEFTYIDAD